MAIQNETKMSSSETCRLIAEQMLADANLAPERNQMLLRAARAWSELSKNLKRTDAAREADPRVISSTTRPRPRQIEAEIDGATFIARW
jgi:hypothetical protein